MVKSSKYGDEPIKSFNPQILRLNCFIFVIERYMPTGMIFTNNCKVSTRPVWQTGFVFISNAQCFFLVHRSDKLFHYPRP